MNGMETIAQRQAEAETPQTLPEETLPSAEVDHAAPAEAPREAEEAEATRAEAEILDDVESLMNFGQPLNRHENEAALWDDYEYEPTGRKSVRRDRRLHRSRSALSPTCTRRRPRHLHLYRRRP